MFEYIFIFKFFLIAVLVSAALTIISLILIKQNPDIEKYSSYECGFNPFGDARNKFDIKFYLIGILFLVFDLELAFIFPWVVSFQTLNPLGIIVLYIFVAILTFVLL